MIADNPVLPEAINDLQAVTITITPNEISYRLAQQGIQATDDDVLSILGLFSLASQGALDFDLTMLVFNFLGGVRK